MKCGTHPAFWVGFPQMELKNETGIPKRDAINSLLPIFTSVPNCMQVQKCIVFHQSCFSSIKFSHLILLTLSDPMDCSTPGFPVHHQLPELT